jgi:hypothetical protein
MSHASTLYEQDYEATWGAAGHACDWMIACTAVDIGPCSPAVHAVNLPAVLHDTKLNAAYTFIAAGVGGAAPSGHRLAAMR